MSRRVKNLERNGACGSKAGFRMGIDFRVSSNSLCFTNAIVGLDEKVTEGLSVREFQG